ncbi:MAG: hypothetical protein ACE367_03245 [Acidimicrobiales bacterium]
MVAMAEDPTRFRQSAPFGPYDVEVVIELPEPGRITYAWRWAEAGGTPVEQSKADVRLSAA